jgi:cell division transport system ATP-binding protein
VLQATDWREPQKIELRIREVLTQVQLPDAYHRMPWELSGGEQQRVAIARALLNYPELLIADEPTGNLDAETSREILRLMRQLSQQYNTAVLFATHDQMVMDAFPARVLACNGQQLEERSN